METVDTLTGKLDTLKTDVGRALGDLKADVQQIADLLAAQGTVPPEVQAEEVQAKLAALGTGLDDLDAAVNAADPAPPTLPAPPVF